MDVVPCDEHRSGRVGRDRRLALDRQSRVVVDHDVSRTEPDRVVHLQQRVRLVRDRTVRVELRARRHEDPAAATDLADPRSIRRAAGPGLTLVQVIANGEPVDLDEGATVDDLLRALRLGGKWVLVERNGEPVPRPELTTTPLNDGDTLELVRAVAGG